MSQLKIAHDLGFPLDAVTQTFGILAVRGAGKSNTGAVMAEEMYAAKLPFVVVDPVGSWWGLRSSGDGAGPGLSVPIFGGKHGDVPLERAAGELIADLVVERRVSCVLDMSLFESEADKKYFLLAFARRLYTRNEDPLHLFLEEADDYIPQKPMRDEAQLLRAWENIVRRGRGRGLGMTLITQRSAAINKMVLTQIETLIAMRTTSPQDRAAVESWVKWHQVSEEIVSSLSGLENGEAWVWSPHYLGLTKRVRVRRRYTFDSGATPKNFGAQARRAPATMADIDLSALQERMKATIERAKAEDPRELHRRISSLETELQKAKAAPPAVDPAAIERAREQGWRASELIVESLRAAVIRLHKNVLAELQTGGHAISEAVKQLEATLDDGQLYEKSVQPGPCAPGVGTPEPPRPPARPTEARSGPPSGSSSLPHRMHRAMLTALAQHPDGLTKAQVRLHTGYADSGPVSSAFANLVRMDWIVDVDRKLRITRAGQTALGDYEPLPTGSALRQHLLDGDKLSKVERALLRAVCDVYPHPTGKGEVRRAAGYADSGPVSNAFARLARYGYIVSSGSGRVRASDVLFVG